jgi:transcription-repair coupling factor (superfamily II helicase)
MTTDSSTENQAKNSIVNGWPDQLPDQGSVACTGLTAAAAAYWLARQYRRQPHPMLVVTATPNDALRMGEDLDFFLAGSLTSVLRFPAYNLLPYKILTYHNETAAERIQVLYQAMAAGQAPILLTTVGALMHRILPKRALLDFVELIQTHEELDRDALASKLVVGGYTRTQIVEEPGDFSVRGGIVDLFSPGYTDPLRIEFFGDTVESIRSFSAVTQRQVGAITEAVILPAREVILPPERLTPMMAAIRALAADIGIPVSRTRGIIDRLRNEMTFPGIESLLPLVYDRMGTLLDYLPPGTRTFLLEPADLERTARETAARLAVHYESAREEKRLCLAPERLVEPWESLWTRLQAGPVVELRQLSRSSGAERHSETSTEHRQTHVQDVSEVTHLARHPEEGQSPFQAVALWLQQQNRAGIDLHILCHSAQQAERLRKFLAPYGEPPATAEGFTPPRPDRAASRIVIGRLSAGFIWPQARLGLITENDLLGTRPKRKTTPVAKSRGTLLAFEDLKQDDLVVHADHGIGRYEGLSKLRIEGLANDFLALVYRGGDRLYLPVDRMGLIQKYMGVEGVTPELDKMGGLSWERVKARVKRSAEKIAGELLRLYAERKVREGYVFREIDEYMAQFEAGFPFEETPDQLRAIEDVLQDMRRTTPMDRLICGDVGYGKTEVALRASVLAIQNGKQVAVLVPTTVLAEQHHETFQERFRAFPVQIECLNRFRPPKEQRRILEALRTGRVDIVIGTHRLLQKDVAFRDLGLFVIDEEQRFGVRHKERLKEIRSTVDTLALTATPIPRTLHLSLTGIRDISIISTPPEYRRAIVTYISEYDEAVIVEAIRRELERGGQVYFVHNHVKSIHRMADNIRRLVPEARLDVAHGQMDEENLERVMLRFFGREVDVLVTTTIIESGLDIPTANTIIVNRADRFGLAQMYQLRGRVGRSDEQAYAFLFIPAESHLTPEARKRLKVLMEHSDLGSGFQIAMSDLKIRGGGTILGASQSGHIAAVGYDMFLQLMEEAVAELKGEPVRQDLEPEINMAFSAFIPDGYVPSIDQRLSLYRRLARARDLAEVAELRGEMQDRFGPLPAESGNLFFKIMLRILAIQAGVKRVDLGDGQLVLTFSPDHQHHPERVAELIMADPTRFKPLPDHVLTVRLVARKPLAQLAEARNLLKEIGRRVNQA